MALRPVGRQLEQSLERHAELQSKVKPPEQIRNKPKALS